MIRSKTLVAAAAVACGVQGQGTWTSVALAPVSSVADSLVRPAIAVDADGNPAVACVESGTLVVRKWNGTSWAAMGGAVNSGGGAAKSVAMAVDPSGLAAVWEDAGSTVHVLRAARFDGAGWVPLAAQINASGSSGQKPRLATGPQGLFAAYSGGSPGAAVVSRWTGTAWQDWPATPSQNAPEVELSLLPDGSPAVAWLRSSAQTGTIQWEVATRSWSMAPRRYGRQSLPNRSGPRWAIPEARPARAVLSRNCR